MNTKFFLLTLALVVFFPSVIALDACANPLNNNGYYWTIESISDFSGDEYKYSIDTACGVCYLGDRPYGSTCVNNYDNRILHFLYKTKAQPNRPVQLFQFEIKRHFYNGGANDDAWDVGLNHPFLGTTTQIRAEEKFNLNFKSGFGAGCAAGAGTVTVGGTVVLIAAWTGPPGWLASGGIIAAGCLIGGFANSASGVGTINTPIMPIGGHPIGRIEATLDHDNSYWAQVDKLDLYLNKKAIDIIEAIYSYSPAELAEGGYGSYEQLFYNLGQVDNAKKMTDAFDLLRQMKKPKESAKIEAEIANSRAAAKAGFLGLEPPKPKDEYWLPFHSTPVILDYLNQKHAALKPEAKTELGISDDVLGEVKKANPTVAVTVIRPGQLGSPRLGKWLGDTTTLVVPGINAGDSIQMNLNLPGYFDPVTGKPGVGTFTGRNIEGTELHDRA